MSQSSSDRLIYDEDSGNPSMFDEAATLRAKLRSFKLFKPPFVLGLFVAMNFWTYYDRGCMATSIGNIRSDSTIAGDGKTISETNAGFLVSVFMVGFLVASPIFAGLGGIIKAKTIILIGLLTWCAACIMTGVVHGFAVLLITRAFVGVGEAAYAGYTVTMVDNMAPPHLRTLWIGIFYAMIPVGTAMGMVMGGVLSSKGNTADLAGWRLCFLTEVVPMFVVIGFMLFLPQEYNPVKADSKSQQAAVSEDAPSANAPLTGGPNSNGDDFVPIWVAFGRLFTNLDYLLLVLGYGMYTFVVGGVSVWAVSFMNTGPLALSKITASIFLGGATALTGLLGSLAGGVAVDKMGGSIGFNGIYKCGLFSAGMMVISLPCGIIALMSTSFAVFGIFFVASVFALFAVTAPVNSAILTVVPKNLRTYAITVSITLMHLCGDVPSPVVAGAISDAFDGGCSHWNNDEISCKASLNAKSCVWVPKESHSDAYCTSEYQLRNALVLVYVFMFLAIPSWGIVAFRMRNRKGDADHPEGPFGTIQSTTALRDLDKHE